MSDQFIHDAEYYIVELQNREKWASPKWLPSAGSIPQISIVWPEKGPCLPACIQSPPARQAVQQ